MPERSSTSAAATSPRRQQLEEAILAYARRIMDQQPEVAEIIWFGSWVTGQPGRCSDVDLCVLLSASPIARTRDRIPLYIPDRFPGGVDVFPYTLEEFASLEREAPSWWRAIRSGRTVAKRA